MLEIRSMPLHVFFDMEEYARYRVCELKAVRVLIKNQDRSREQIHQIHLGEIDIACSYYEPK